MMFFLNKRKVIKTSTKIHRHWTKLVSDVYGRIKQCVLSGLHKTPYSLWTEWKLTIKNFSVSTNQLWYNSAASQKGISHGILVQRAMAPCESIRVCADFRLKATSWGKDWNAVCCPATLALWSNFQSVNIIKLFTNEVVCVLRKKNSLNVWKENAMMIFADNLKLELQV